jgi:hypothetical protein
MATPATTGNPVFDFAVVISLGLIALRGGGQAVRITLMWLWAKIRGADTEWTGIRQAPREIKRVEDKVDLIASDVAGIKTLLNGGGLGSKMAEVTEDLRELRQDLTDAVATMTANQDRIEATMNEKVDRLGRKVDNRLFVLEERDRAQTASLHELGFDADLPPSHDAAD